MPKLSCGKGAKPVYGGWDNFSTNGAEAITHHIKRRKEEEKGLLTETQTHKPEMTVRRNCEIKLLEHTEKFRKIHVPIFVSALLTKPSYRGNLCVHYDEWLKIRCACVYVYVCM